MAESKEDEASIAFFVAEAISSSATGVTGWEAEGLDIGEVELLVPNGQRFRLSIEEVLEEF